MADFILKCFLPNGHFSVSFRSHAYHLKLTTVSPLARETRLFPPRGNFADMVFLKEHHIRNILSHVCTLAVGAFRIFGVKREKLCKNH